MLILSDKWGNRLFIDELFFLMEKNRVIYKKNKILSYNVVQIIKYNKI